MARHMGWRPIQERIDSVLAGKQQRIKSQLDYIERETAEMVRYIETTAQAAALLDAAGYTLELYSWDSGRTLEIDLGLFAHTKAGKRDMAAAIMHARKALGARRLEVYNKAVDDAGDDKKTVIKVTLKCDEFPGVRIHYSVPPTKSKKVKCRVVTKTYKALVCGRED